MFSRSQADFLCVLFLSHVFVVCLGSDSNPFTTEDAFCGPPPRIENAHSNRSTSQSRFAIGTVIQYQCQVGSSRVGRSGDQYATCTGYDSGVTSWNGPFISCPTVNCGDPGSVPNADRNIEGVSFGSYVTFQCREGYALSGSNRRFCQADGRWSGSNPECNIVSCPVPANPDNGMAVYSSVVFGSEVRFQCHGYRRVTGNNPRRHCLASGIWNGTQPTCEFVDCGLPPDNFTSGYARLSNTANGQVVDYQCEDGAITTSYCLPSGVWHLPPPDCMYIVPSTTAAPTPRQNKCSNRFTCFFSGVRRGICSGLRKIGIRICKAD